MSMEPFTSDQEYSKHLNEQITAKINETNEKLDELIKVQKAIGKLLQNHLTASQSQEVATTTVEESKPTKKRVTKNETRPTTQGGRA